MSRQASLGILWNARCSSISLSLAHHSSHVAASEFDRKFRSAYMDVEFELNNATTSPSSDADDAHFNLKIIRIHAVMQPAAIGELGDLVDYVQVRIM